MSAEAGVLAFVAKWLWVAVIGLCGWIWKSQDSDIKALKASAKESVSKQEAKDMIKEAVQPVRDELGRFQQQVMDKITEIGLTVKQTSDNVTKLSTEFTVQVEVQKVKEALSKQQKEGNNL